MVFIETNCGHKYVHKGITNVRLAKRELRWTNARGEPRSMALCFIRTWDLSELH